MRLAALAIEGLFGLFKHRIEFKLLDGITIIHGPNGCGKTTVLKMIYLVFGGNFEDLFEIRFERMILKFDDLAELRITRQVNSRARDRRTPGPEQIQEFTVIFTLQRPNEGALTFELKKLPGFAAISNLSASRIQRDIPFISRLDKDTWQDTRDGELISNAELIVRFPRVFGGARRLMEQTPPDWLKSLIDALQVHFIQTQRLLKLAPRSHNFESAGSHRPTVNEYADDLIARIRSALAESVQQAQQLDREFPIRVLNQHIEEDVSTDDIRNRYQDQQTKRKRLTDAGLIAHQLEFDLPGRQLDPTERRLLWIYLNDVDSKLALFDPLLQKIEVFKDIINSRFLNKTIRLDRQVGFVFTATDGRTVPLEALSSGEQHELVLSYELLFRVKRGSMILIDEPELSLHVTWQHKFLGDLTRISKLAGLDFLIATHSPQIIHKRWDLAVALADEDHEEIPERA